MSPAAVGWRLAIPVAVLATLALGACSRESPPAAPVAPSPAALDFPEPPGWESFEPAVREQYRERRQAVAAAEATPGDVAARAAAWGELGTWHLAYQHLQLAGPALDRARELAPDEVRWTYYAAHLARIQGRIEEARALLGKVLELRPEDLPSRVWLGQLELEAGDPAAARSWFEEVLARDPRHLRARLGLGRAALAEGRWEEASSHLEAVRRAAPQATDWRYPLGQAWSQLGRGEAAAPLLAAAGLPPEERRSVPLVDPLLAALDEVRIDEVIRLTRARRLAEEGRWEEALAALPETPETREGLETAASILFRTGRDEAACVHVEALGRLAPEATPTRVFQGLCAEGAGDLAGAETLFRAALAADPEAHAARERLARILLATGRVEEALALYDAWVAARPRDPQAHFQRTAAVFAAQRWPAAGAALAAGRAAAPDHSGLLLLEARLRAASPEAGQRDPARSMELARELWSRQRDLAAAETVAMALAAAGHPADAAVWQEAARTAVAEGGVTAPWVARRLDHYRAGRPPSRPWEQDELFLAIPVPPPAPAGAG